MEASGKASVASLVHFLNKGKKYNLKGRGKVRSLERVVLIKNIWITDVFPDTIPKHLKNCYSQSFWKIA